MAKWDIDDREIDRQIAEAAEATREAAEREPLAREVFYDPVTKKIVVELTTGGTFSFPFYLAQGLTGASQEQLEGVEITPLGDGLRWRELDVTLDLPGLMLGVYGTRSWMAEIGKMGGQATSVAKVAAARLNGMKGGRPAKAVGATAVHVHKPSGGVWRAKSAKTSPTKRVKSAAASALRQSAKTHKVSKHSDKNLGGTRTTVRGVSKKK